MGHWRTFSLFSVFAPPRNYALCMAFLFPSRPMYTHIHARIVMHLIVFRVYLVCKSAQHGHDVMVS